MHSTSWRHEERRLILTYVAVVAPPEDLNEYLADEPIARADLARGDAFDPPPEIGVTQVLEHAFRHLSWLVKDDAVLGEALATWVAFLEAYEPPGVRSDSAGTLGARLFPMGSDQPPRDTGVSRSTPPCR